MAQEVFGGPEAGSFGAGYKTIEWASAYDAVALAPVATEAASAAGSWTANATGMLGPAAGRVFWSGASSGGVAASEYIAEHPGSTTLEATPLGKAASFVQRYVPESKFTYSAWSWLSTAYAQGAEGTATYFEGAGGYQGRIWTNYEMPTLFQKGIPIVTIPHQ